MILLAMMMTNLSISYWRSRTIDIDSRMSITYLTSIIISLFAENAIMMWLTILLLLSLSLSLSLSLFCGE